MEMSPVAEVYFRDKAEEHLFWSLFKHEKQNKTH